MQPEYSDSAMDDFLARVQQQSGLTSREEADQVTRATLTALGERISGGQMSDLAALLPRQLTPEVEHGRGQAKSFDKGAFLDRVSGDIGTTDLDAVERETRGVLRTLQEWAPEGEVDNTLAQLPPELAGMFE
ncbi:DUF2267 domain-containing protein [Salinactinospora qingdaonensis]|uniref:DUF2267 domain-containing protein n=1 Tax=Salinactinospora qingdaonensis TaxID=702744 RepID=A0ABP7FZJ8_9ACTN